MAENIVITPPSLLGMDRRIAYAHKKYHSGLMCRGVANGLAGIKFSGSPNMFGARSEAVIKRRRKMDIPIRSFVVKNG